MERTPKNVFEIKLKKETRKQIIKRCGPIIFGFYLVIFLVFALAGNATGLGIIGWLESQMPISIVAVILCIALFPFLWFMAKPQCRDTAYKKLLEDISKARVEEMMTPEVLSRVILIKPKCDFGDFVLELQKEGKVKLYAKLGEKDNLVAIYAVLLKEAQLRHFDVVTKGEFADFYEFIEDKTKIHIL